MARARVSARWAISVPEVLASEWAASWLGADGARQSTVRLDVTGLWRAAASPSGRYALLLEQQTSDAPTVRSRGAVLVDLERGRSRRWTLPALPGGVAWSLAGDAVAIGTDEGTVVLLEATPRRASAGREAEPAREEATGGGWLELRREDRFWRIRAAEGEVEVHYGVRGAQGRRQRVPCDDPAREQARRVRAKRRAGYREV